MTPGKAIRKFCLSCAGTSEIVKDCQGDRLLNGPPCPLFKYRMGKGRPSVKSIRAHCVHCCNKSNDIIRECPDTECTLHKFRMGRNPHYPQREGWNEKKSPGIVTN